MSSSASEPPEKDAHREEGRERHHDGDDDGTAAQLGHGDSGERMAGPGYSALFATGVASDVRQVAVPLADVEAVPDHELGRDAEPDVLEVELDALEAVLHEERAHLERRGIAGGEVLAQVREREPAVDDVLDDDHVATAEVEVEVLDDPHDAARARRRAVRRHRHEVELDREVDRPREVAHEHERALEHADEQRRAPGVVGRDLLAELGDAAAQLVLADHDRTDVGVLDH